MVPELSAVCGEAVAEIAHDTSALDAVVGEFTREECTRENILGAAGVLSWAVAFQGGPQGGSKAGAELTKRVALLTLIACYSGGLPRRDPSDVYERLRLKAEIRENAGANAEYVGCLDVAQLHYERACTLRALAIELMHR